MEAPPYNGRLRALARAIGIDHSHLAKVLDGDRGFSPKVVGRVARLLPDVQADALIRSYLREVASEIGEHHKKPPVMIK